MSIGRTLYSAQFLDALRLMKLRPKKDSETLLLGSRLCS